MSDIISHQFLSFSLGGEALAVPVEQVREIIEYTPLTIIPGIPVFLRGLINLRGTVVPVIDLQARIGKPPTPIQRRTCIVIVEFVQEESTVNLGMLVDSVNEVITMEPEKIDAAPIFGVDLRPDFISGVLNLENRFVIALDLKQVLSIEELSSLISLKQEPTCQSA